jgi:hypothetical protein
VHFEEGNRVAGLLDEGQAEQIGVGCGVRGNALALPTGASKGNGVLISTFLTRHERPRGQTVRERRPVGSLVQNRSRGERGATEEGGSRQEGTGLGTLLAAGRLQAPPLVLCRWGEQYDCKRASPEGNVISPPILTAAFSTIGTAIA